MANVFFFFPTAQVVDEASHALIEADTAHCVAYVTRAARLLERRGSVIEAFGACVAKVEMSMEARKATVEALKLELQLESLGLGAGETKAMQSAAAVTIAGNREAMSKAAEGDMRYKPMLILKYLAAFAATTHDPRGAGAEEKRAFFFLGPQPGASFFRVTNSRLSLPGAGRSGRCCTGS